MTTDIYDILRPWTSMVLTDFFGVGLSHIVSCHKDHAFIESSWHDTWFLWHRCLLTRGIVTDWTLSGRIYWMLQWVSYWNITVWCDTACHVWLIACNMNKQPAVLYVLCIFYISSFIWLSWDCSVRTDLLF